MILILLFIFIIPFVFAQPACTINSDCGQSSSQLVCDILYIFNVTENPICLSGSCSYPQTWVYNSFCDFGCFNGACTFNCSVDNDCGTDYYTPTVCIEGNAYHDFYDYSCIANECKKNVRQELSEECRYGCSNGTCIKCLVDENCGINSFVGQNYCMNDDVYRDFKEFKCIDPGTRESKCVDNINLKLIEECREPYCESWGENYCKDNEVYHSRICYNSGCFLGSCFINSYLEEESIKICRDLCINGKCFPDKDRDRIPDARDLCQDTKPGEDVDNDGCSNSQFCQKQGLCGNSCNLADWKGNEKNSKNPHDCLTIIIHKEGVPYPYCAGLTCAD